jgi:hypothetical protein
LARWADCSKILGVERTGVETKDRVNAPRERDFELGVWARVERLGVGTLREAGTADRGWEMDGKAML